MNLVKKTRQLGVEAGPIFLNKIPEERPWLAGEELQKAREDFPEDIREVLNYFEIRSRAAEENTELLLNYPHPIFLQLYP